jgi:hypothetical protein
VVTKEGVTLVALTKLFVLARSHRTSYYGRSCLLTADCQKVFLLGHPDFTLEAWFRSTDHEVLRIEVLGVLHFKVLGLRV